MIDRGMLDYVMDRIRPQIEADGGDVSVTKIDDETGTVYVALHGACADCPLSSLTLSQGIERVLVEHVPGVEKVEQDPDSMQAMMDNMGGNGIFGWNPAEDDDDDEFSDRFGDPVSNPVRVTRIDREGNITEGTM